MLGERLLCFQRVEIVGQWIAYEEGQQGAQQLEGHQHLSGNPFMHRSKDEQHKVDEREIVGDDTSIRLLLPADQTEGVQNFNHQSTQATQFVQSKFRCADVQQIRFGIIFGQSMPRAGYKVKQLRG